jgi:hypothetical protein
MKHFLTMFGVLSLIFSCSACGDMDEIMPEQTESGDVVGDSSDDELIYLFDSSDEKADQSTTQNGQDYFSFRCMNPDCEAENRIDTSLITAAEQTGKKIVVVCGNCGAAFSYNPITQSLSPLYKTVNVSGIHPHSQPVGIIAGGYKDYMGRVLGRVEFLKKHGVDPRIYWQWIKRGRPRAID